MSVRPDGKFSLPLLGDVQAAGLTTVQLAEHITEKLLAYHGTTQELYGAPLLGSGILCLDSRQG